jgi:helix-turn-helix protein
MDRAKKAGTVSIRNTLPFATVPEWLLLDPRASDRAVRLYGVLIRHADRSGRAHPSRRRLAHMLGCSESSLDRAMKELVEVGALEVQRKTSDSGDWDVNDYILHPGGVTDEPTPGVTTEATGGVTDDEQNESHLEREPFERERPTDPSGLVASDPATRIETELREVLKDRGVVLPRDWHLKARGELRRLLNAENSPGEDRIVSAIGAALDDRWWSTKLADPHKIADAVNELVQRNGQRNGRGARSGQLAEEMARRGL